MFSAFELAQLALAAIREGVPLVVKIIEVVKSSDSAEAKALIPQLEADYAAAVEERRAAFTQSQL